MRSVGRQWQGQQGLNPRPTVLETVALPTELYPYAGQGLRQGRGEIKANLALLRGGFVLSVGGGLKGCWMQLGDVNWAGRPWEAVTDAMLAEALKVPSMLTADEARLYYWLAARAEGTGAVIDLGSHRGGSAARLLAGLAAGKSAALLYTYDRFATPEGETDMLTQVRTALAPWGDRTVFVKGDIARQDWAGGAVEILAVDAAKSPRTADRIADQFLPALEPGRSVLVHQDFLHSKQPWLSAQMAALADCFTLVALAGKFCAVFVPTVRITAAELEAARTVPLDDAGLIAGITAAEQAFSPFLPARLFAAQRQMVLTNPGVRDAWRMRH